MPEDDRECSMSNEISVVIGALISNDRILCSAQTSKMIATNKILLLNSSVTNYFRLREAELNFKGGTLKIASWKGKQPSIGSHDKLFVELIQFVVANCWNCSFVLLKQT